MTQPGIPRNPYSADASTFRVSPDAAAIGTAVLALALEQHQRNRIAAITAKHRGIQLPADLEALAEEEIR